MKIAIIGCGKQAPKHISGFRTNGIDRFVCYDVNTAAASELAAKNGAEVATDLDAIFNDPQVDAVDICTPIAFHHPLASRAIAAGKPFFCEKPLTASLAEDEDLLARAGAAGVTGMVGYIYRFVPTLELGKQVCDEGALGKVHSAIFRIGGRGSHMAWKHRKATGGGALNEMAVHMIDLAYWYFGAIDKVELLEVGLRQPQRRINGEVVDCDAEDWVVASLTSRSGVNILLQADLVTPAFTQYVEIQGDEGSFAGSIDPAYASYLHLPRPWGDYKAGRNAVAQAPADFFKNQMAEFVGALRGNTLTRNTLADSVAVMTIQQRLKQLAERR